MTRQQLHARIRAMSPAQRQKYVILARLEGDYPRTIADTLGISIGTVHACLKDHGFTFGTKKRMRWYFYDHRKEQLGITRTELILSGADECVGAYPGTTHGWEGR